MEIGDTIDTPQEAERADAALGDAPARTPRRRKPTSGKSRRNGNGSRNGGGSSGGGNSGQELAELLAGLRDLRDGDFTIRLAG